MRIPSGKTDQNIYFVAVDAADLVTRETALSSFTVVRSRNGAADVTYTTPTVTEIDATTMPGVYSLLIDEDTTIASGSDSEEYCVHITQAAMAPVTRTIELYRRAVTTGETLNVSSGALNAISDGLLTAAKFAADFITAAKIASDVGTEIATAVWASATRLLTAGTNIALAKGTGVTGFNDLDAAGVRTAVGLASANLDTQIAAISTTLGAAGAGLSAIPWNATWDAEVQSEVNDGLVAQRLDELLNADSDIDGAQPPTVGSVFHELLTKTAGSFTYDQTTDSLEALRDRGDAAWITATGFSTHSAADIWSVGTRVLTAGTNIQLPSNGLANVTAWTVAITGNITGDLSGSVGSVTDKTGYALTSAYDFAKGTVAMTESYAANGAAPTPIQAIFAQHQMLMQFGISGTNLTVRKLDNVATAFVVTLDDATTPTDASRV